MNLKKQLIIIIIVVMYLPYQGMQWIYSLKFMYLPLKFEYVTDLVYISKFWNVYTFTVLCGFHWHLWLNIQLSDASYFLHHQLVHDYDNPKKITFSFEWFFSFSFLSPMHDARRRIRWRFQFHIITVIEILEIKIVSSLRNKVQGFICAVELFRIHIWH